MLKLIKLNLGSDQTVLPPKFFHLVVNLPPFMISRSELTFPEDIKDVRNSISLSFLQFGICSEFSPSLLFLINSTLSENLNVKSFLGLVSFFNSILTILLDLGELFVGDRFERFETLNFLLHLSLQALIFQFLINRHLFPHPSGVLVRDESFSCNFCQQIFVIILIFEIWVIVYILILCEYRSLRLSFRLVL